MILADLSTATQGTLTQEYAAIAGLPYCSPEPYPSPAGLSRNIRYARILQYIYSAGSSELTGIHQYLYHSIVTGQELPALSQALKGIAMVEIHHLHLLGECIMQLGLLPTFGYYQGTRRARWSSGFVQYARNPKGIVELSIQTEMQAIEHYRSSAGQISDEQITALLYRIIEDEKVHIKILEELLEISTRPQ